MNKDKETMAREWALSCDQSKIRSYDGYTAVYNNLVYGYLSGFDAGQAQLLEQAASGFADYYYHSDIYKDHEENARAAWQASQLSSDKVLAEKDKEIKRLKKNIEELDYCQKAFYEATKKVGW